MPDQKITELTAWTTPISTDVVPIVDVVGVATKKITLANLGIIDGWMPASEDWTYASATTITVPSGAASKYQKGDRIKLTQTTVKYFYIVIIADTLLTVVGDGAVVVTDAAISANFYSHQASPLGFPSAFYFAPNVIGSGTMTVDSIQVQTMYFSLTGDMLTGYVGVRVTLGGTATNAIEIAMPVKCLETSTGVLAGVAGIYDGGEVSGWWYNQIVSAVYYFTVGKNTPNWGLGADKLAKFVFCYKIA